MRICYLADAASIHIQRWVAYFAERGHEVHVITFATANADKALTHHLRPFRRHGRLGYLLAALEIRRVIGRIAPNILHVHFLTSYGLLGALTFFHPLLATAHGSDVLVSPRRSTWASLAVRLAVRRADVVTAVAKHMVPALQRFGASPGRLLYVPNWVDDKVFNPFGRLADPAGRAVVLSDRALKPLYDVETLVKAIPLVVKEGCPMEFVIIGEGSEEGKLKRYVSSTNLENHVRFAPPLPHRELAGHLRAADIYVSTSLSDGLSVSLLEAMACGAFPVVTDIPGNRELIEDGKNGYLFPAGDVQALADRLVRAAKERALADQARQWNWQLVRERHSESVVMPKVEGLYQRLAMANRKSAFVALRRPVHDRKAFAEGERRLVPSRLSSFDDWGVDRW